MSGRRSARPRAANVEGDMDKHAPIVKPALKHEAMKVVQFAWGQLLGRSCEAGTHGFHRKNSPLAR
jgi:hypothetical protein